MYADLAQLVEHRFCKPTVVGSIPIVSSIYLISESWKRGEIAERPKATDCKSVGLYLRRFESFSLHHFLTKFFYAGVAQLVERHPSKVDVASSNLVARSILYLNLNFSLHNFNLHLF